MRVHKKSNNLNTVMQQGKHKDFKVKEYFVNLKTYLMHVHGLSLRTKNPLKHL